MAKTGKFSFTITDLARLLGKSSATLRLWEQQGWITLDRVGDDRRASPIQAGTVAEAAFSRKRISKNRLRLIIAICTLLEIVEENK